MQTILGSRLWQRESRSPKGNGLPHEHHNATTGKAELPRCAYELADDALSTETSVCRMCGLDIIDHVLARCGRVLLL